MAQYNVRVRVGDRVRSRETGQEHLVMGIEPSTLGVVAVNASEEHPEVVGVGELPVRLRLQDVLLEGGLTVGAVEGCLMGLYWEGPL